MRKRLRPFGVGDPPPPEASAGSGRQGRFSVRGCDKAIFSEKKGFSVKRGEAIQ